MLWSKYGNYFFFTLNSISDFFSPCTFLGKNNKMKSKCIFFRFFCSPDRLLKSTILVFLQHIKCEKALQLSGWKNQQRTERFPHYSSSACYAPAGTEPKQERLCQRGVRNSFYRKKDWLLLDQTADDTQRIVDGALRLVDHQLVGAPDHDAHRLPRAAAAGDLHRGTAALVRTTLPHGQSLEGAMFAASADSIPSPVCQSRPGWPPLPAPLCRAFLEWSGRCERWAWCR